MHIGRDGISVSELKPDAPLNMKYGTQNPSLSPEQAKLADGEFCASFLKKVKSAFQLEFSPQFNNDHSFLSPSTISNNPNIVPRNILPLRSPQASALKDFIHYPSFKDLGFLTDAEYMYVYLAHSQSGKKNDPSCKYGMNGFMQSFFPDHKRAIQLLFDLGLCLLPDLPRTLHSMTIPQLKEILLQHHISVSSKSRKTDLIQTIIEQVDSERIPPSIWNNSVFELSDFGYIMVHSLYNDAHIPKLDEKIIFSPSDPYLRRKQEVQTELDNFRRNGIRQVSSLCALDIRTCPECGARDKVPVDVYDAIVGENLPPFHQGCRCVVIAHFEDAAFHGRSARNPETNKTYTTNARTYSEWIKRIHDL